MDIKEQIDALSEAEAKAALWAILRSRGAFLYITEHEKTIDEYAIFELEAALKEAHGVVAKNATTYERPLPCQRDEHGKIEEQTVKALFAKINEELDELKFEITTCLASLDTNITKEPNDEWAYDTFVRNKARGAIVAEEAADTITAITTLLKALGIDAEMRDEAQRRVNSKNRERGRL